MQAGSQGAQEGSTLAKVAGGLSAVLSFLSDEIGRWRLAAAPGLERCSSPGGVEDSGGGGEGSGALEAGAAPEAAAVAAEGGALSGLPGAAPAPGPEPLLEALLRRLSSEAAARPQLSAMRPSEREGPLWLAGEPMWAVLRRGILALFANKASDGMRPPDDGAVRCALRLDLRLAIVELHDAGALDPDLWRAKEDGDGAEGAGGAEGVGASAPPPRAAVLAAGETSEVWRVMCRAVGRSLQVLPEGWANPTVILDPNTNPDRSLQVHASHGLVEVSAPTLGAAFAWQAALTRSARAFHVHCGTQHALALLLPLQGRTAAADAHHQDAAGDGPAASPSSGAAASTRSTLVEALRPLADTIAERLSLPQPWPQPEHGAD